MNRDQKTEQIKEIASGLSEAAAVFAVDYRGISVPQAAELRGKLGESDATFKVVKNRLAKLAIEQAGTEGLDGLLEGPTALTLIKGDPVVAAKTISNFTRDHNVLVFKGGLMDGEPLAPDQFLAIARLPGLDTLRGQLVGLTASPLTGLAAGLSNLISGLGRQLAQMADQGLVTGEAPEPAVEEPEAEESEPAEEPAADEAPAETSEETENDSPEEVEGEAETSEGDENDENDDSPEAVEGEAETPAGEEEE
jgi:large subunit ribosomal protein L10